MTVVPSALHAPTVRSRLWASGVAFALGFAVANVGILRILGPDRVLWLAVAAVLMLTGAVGVLLADSGRRVSMWAVLGLEALVVAVGAPLLWLVTLAGSDSGPTSLAPTDAGFGRFRDALAEARLLRRIDSDLVVRVHDIGESDGRPYFVMDLVSGGTIADVDETVTPLARLRLAAACARAVDAVHRAGVAHRDIKPSNILVDRSGAEARVVVADLGTAKALADGTGFTMTAGTPVYMAPEQAMGGRIDERCDVYSLAVVTYELLSGRLPHSADSLPLDRQPPERFAVDLGLPATLDATLRSALAVDPRRRPSDASALAALLERDVDAASHPPVRLWPTRWVVALAVVMAAASGVVSWWVS